MSPARIKSYATPEAFKNALATRIRDAVRAKPTTTMNRFRQVLAFERFLDRPGRALGDHVVAKGGVVLELRLERALATKDVDLLYRGDASALRRGAPGLSVAVG